MEEEVETEAEAEDPAASNVVKRAISHASAPKTAAVVAKVAPGKVGQPVSSVVRKVISLASVHKVEAAVREADTKVAGGRLEVAGVTVEGKEVAKEGQMYC